MMHDSKVPEANFWYFHWGMWHYSVSVAVVQFGPVQGLCFQTLNWTKGLVQAISRTLNSVLVRFRVLKLDFYLFW